MMSSEMSERYYQKRYGDEFYILDSSIISEKSFDEKLELEGYKAFEDSLAGEEVVDLLNENEQLKKQVQNIHKLINSKIQSARELGNLRTVIALKNLQRELKGDFE